MNVEGKTVVITGASRGIGAPVARMLRARGVERPRHLRMLETALRPMSEVSWG